MFLNRSLKIANDFSSLVSSIYFFVHIELAWCSHDWSPHSRFWKLSNKELKVSLQTFKNLAAFEPTIWWLSSILDTRANAQEKKIPRTSDKKLIHSDSITFRIIENPFLILTITKCVSVCLTVKLIYVFHLDRIKINQPLMYRWENA